MAKIDNTLGGGNKHDTQGVNTITFENSVYTMEQGLRGNQFWALTHFIQLLNEIESVSGEITDDIPSLIPQHFVGVPDVQSDPTPNFELPGSFKYNFSQKIKSC